MSVFTVSVMSVFGDDDLLPTVVGAFQYMPTNEQFLSCRVQGLNALIEEWDGPVCVYSTHLEYFDARVDTFATTVKIQRAQMRHQWSLVSEFKIAMPHVIFYSSEAMVWASKKLVHTYKITAKDAPISEESIHIVISPASRGHKLFRVHGRNGNGDVTYSEDDGRAYVMGKIAAGWKVIAPQFGWNEAWSGAPIKSSTAAWVVPPGYDKMHDYMDSDWPYKVELIASEVIEAQVCT